MADTKQLIAQVKQSAGMFAINMRDVALGTVVAAGTAAIQIIYEVLNAYLLNGGPLHFDWPVIGKTAVMAGLAYLGKNFLTPAKTIVIAPKDAVKVSETTTGVSVSAKVDEVKIDHKLSTKSES